MYRIDWEQLKKNLEVERREWDEFDRKKQFLKEQMLERIANLEAEKDKVKAEYTRKVKWHHRAYMRHVEKKFKPSIQL
jgi:hypothetical protein